MQLVNKVFTSTFLIILIIFNEIIVFLSFLQAAKTFVDGTKTMAASGHLMNTPFVDEI